MTGRMAAVGTVFMALLLSAALAGSDILIDNDSVRVSLNTYAPGEPSGEHEHLAPRFVYVLSDGTLQSVTESGPPQLTAMVAGTCLYAPPVRHSVDNAGDTTLGLLEVEIKGANGPSRGRAQACSPVEPEEKPRAGRLQRTLLFAGPDLVVSRIVIPPGARDRAGSIRGPRLVFVLEGGPLATRTAGGGKAIATREAALWVDADAPLINQDAHAPLTVLELTPTSGSDSSGER